MATKALDAATFGHAIADAHATKGGAIELGTAIGDFLKSSSGRALTREVVRGVSGMLTRGF